MNAKMCQNVNDKYYKVKKGHKTMKQWSNNEACKELIQTNNLARMESHCLVMVSVLW